MSETPSELELLLTSLKGEQDELDAAIEQMISAMAEVSPEQRAASGWAPDGERTREFLELTNRQTEVEAEIEAVQEAIAAGKPATSVH